MNGCPPIFNEADGVRFLSFCVNLTANLARSMAEEGDCDPQLFESLKAMQLVLDRQLRAINRDGVTPEVMKGLPDIPDQFE